ncbi:reverse transcriptase-like protein [Nymphaea thermarum]|nr:reverse transcriptase-like protein [Nymphaea thermarum]
MASPNSSATSDSPQNAALLANLLPIARTPTSLQHLLVVKLTSNNYMLWENQLLPLLISYNLKGFVDGTKTCRSDTISSEGKDVLNRAYIEWLQLDQLLLGWIIFCLSEPIHSQIVGLRSSYEVWKRLKKGTNNIDDMMIDHQFFKAGKPMAEDNLVLHILRALPQEYNAFKTSIATRSDPLSLIDLYSMMYESQLKEAEIDTSPTINYINKNNPAYSQAKINVRVNNHGGGGGGYYKKNRNGCHLDLLLFALKMGTFKPLPMIVLGEQNSTTFFSGKRITGDKSRVSNGCNLMVPIPIFSMALLITIEEQTESLPLKWMEGKERMSLKSLRDAPSYLRIFSVVVIALEICWSIMGADSNSTPGPDGFPNKFLQASWEIVKPQLFNAIQNFFVSGRLVLKVNRTHIVHIPKELHEVRTHNFRSLSLWNSTLKFLSRIMVRRMCLILCKLTSPNQLAFLLGRSIQESFLLAHGFSTPWPPKKEKSIYLKAGLSKAYDRVDWAFLQSA